MDKIPTKTSNDNESEIDCPEELILTPPFSTKLMTTDQMTNARWPNPQYVKLKLVRRRILRWHRRLCVRKNKCWRRRNPQNDDFRRHQLRGNRFRCDATSEENDPFIEISIFDVETNKMAPLKVFKTARIEKKPISVGPPESL